MTAAFQTGRTVGQATESKHPRAVKVARWTVRAALLVGVLALAKVVFL